MATLKVYSIYHYYDSTNKLNRYYLDIWNIPGKIEITQEQYNFVRHEAKQNGFCRHTHVASPTDVPFSYPEDAHIYVHINVVS